jgi:hypothetical protein
MERIAGYNSQQVFESFDVYVAPDRKRIFGEDPNELLNRLFKGNEKIFLLQGSGFNMASQIKKWIDSYEESQLTSEPIENVKKRLIDQTISDVAGFYFEYISKHDIFPFDLEIIESDSDGKTVFASKYNETLRNLAIPQERDGALLEGIDKAVEMIVNSGPNTVVFLNSPKGWSGLKNNGKDIVFPDNQTYVYWIDNDGNLKAMTLRTNISIDGSESLVGIKNSNDKSSRERIKDVVRSPVKISVVDDGFIAVLDQIEKSTSRKFDELRNEVENREIYNSLTSEENKEVGVILDMLKQFLTNNVNDLDDEGIKELAFNIGKTILDMKDVVNKRKDKFKKATVVNGYDSPDIKYGILSQEVRQLLGCAGGGSEVISGAQRDWMGPLKFKCQNGHENTRPFGQLIPNCKVCGVEMCKS